jgi:hypothetical protein
MRKVLLALTWIVIVGAAALIVVRIAEYDGRSPMEKLEDEVGGETAEPMSLAACPPLTPQISELPARNRKQPHAVVPEGAFGIVACSYYGFGDGTPRSYAIQETLEKEDVELEPHIVAAVVDEVRASERRDEVRDFCPRSDGRRLLEIFRYRHSPPVGLEVLLNGCHVAGAHGRPAITVPMRLLLRLEHLNEEFETSSIVSEEPG